MTANGFGDLWERPVLVAPMAGGPTTPDLVVAAAEAGGFGFLAAGYKSASDVESEIGELRARSSRPFGINVFVPGSPARSPARVRDYVHQLEAEAARLDVGLGQPRWDDDDWTAKTELLVEAAPAMCSFAFGCPDHSVVQALQQRGSRVMVTVTTPAEAELAAATGVDMVCAQGAEAGAHRSAFDDDGPDELLPTLALVSAIRARTAIPVVATGGIAEPADVAAALAAGASAVQAGTAFLLCDESGTNPVHRAALRDPAYSETVLTRAFTGRRARALVNRFVRDHPGAPSAYPEIHHVTRPLRTAAVTRDEPDSLHLWAGTGWRHARTGSAAGIIEWLSARLA